jgi:tRNA(fMet)-specific endonuclease VapC
MNRYMLDTNTVSHLLRKHAAVSKHVVQHPMASLCISAITEAELLFGLAKRPEATTLHLAVHEFLRRVEILDWNSVAADQYGTTRATMEKHGKILTPLDMLIGSHALSLKIVLVTNDQAFAQMPDLQIEDWTVDKARKT